MENQTAVQFLMDELAIYLDTNLTRADKKTIRDQLGNALAKEKAQTIAFHNWMKENDTEGNAERFFHYTDEDMLDKFYKDLEDQSKVIGGL